MHKGESPQKVQEAQAVLGLASRFYHSFAAKANRMANVHPSKMQLKQYFDKLYPDIPNTKRNRAQQVRHELFRLFESGRGQEIPEIGSSLWAAFNAVTEYVDHYRGNPAELDAKRALKLCQARHRRKEENLKLRQKTLTIAATKNIA